MGPGWGDQETPNGAGLSLESHWASWAQHRPHKPGSDTQGSETEQTPTSDWRRAQGQARWTQESRSVVGWLVTATKTHNLGM